MLLTKPVTSSFRVDNFGANPSATPGTSVTSGNGGSEGSWTASGLGTLAQEVAGFYIRVADQATTTGTVNNTFLDIGVDPAGGTSYAEIVSNLIVGGATPFTAAGGGLRWFFPMRIPAGATVGFRARRVTPTTSYTLRVAMRCFGQISGPEQISRGSYCETLGISEGTSVDATSFTPGNAANGSWVDLGAITNPCHYFNFAYQIDNTVITAEYTYIDLAVGDASNKRIVRSDMHGGTTSEQIGTAFGLQSPWDGYAPSPAGTHVYVRGRCNNAPDTGYQCAAYCVGG